MDADQPLGIFVPELGGDERTPVGPGRGEPVIAEPGHQRGPDVGDLPEGDSLGRGGGKAIARQRGHDHVERVRRVAPMGRGIGQRTDHLAIVPEGPRPAVGQDQRHRVRPLAAHELEVDREAVDLGLVGRDRVDLGLGPAPVIALQPVVGELAQVDPVGAIGPAVPAKIAAPAGPCDPVPQVVEFGLRDIDDKWIHQQPPSCRSPCARRPAGHSSP